MKVAPSNVLYYHQLRAFQQRWINPKKGSNLDQPCMIGPTLKLCSRLLQCCHFLILKISALCFEACEPSRLNIAVRLSPILSSPQLIKSHYEKRACQALYLAGGLQPDKPSHLKSSISVCLSIIRYIPSIACLIYYVPIYDMTLLHTYIIILLTKETRMLIDTTFIKILPCDHNMLFPVGRYHPDTYYLIPLIFDLKTPINFMMEFVFEFHLRKMCRK